VILLYAHSVLLSARDRGAWRFDGVQGL